MIGLSYYVTPNVTVAATGPGKLRFHVACFYISFKLRLKR